MRVSLEWLAELCPTAATANQIAAKLTWLGFEVEAVESSGDDTVLDIAVTPNRPDMLGMLGVARELSAAFGLSLRLPESDLAGLEADPPIGERTAVKVVDATGCGRYIARVVDGIRVLPSPSWMRRRLEACGIRAISNLVDITNYVLLETGHPLHAFDLDRLSQRRIVVRPARTAERMRTLDGTECTLSPADCLICDADQPIALAGIMGGANSEVSASTRTVLLEAAFFDPQSIRKTRRRLGLSTESSVRFERGCDPNGAEFASRRAAMLVAQLCGGRIATGCIDTCSQPTPRREIVLRPERCRMLLGVDVSTEHMVQRLTPLGFEIHPRDDGLHVSVPTYRPDVSREADLVEEVARTGGLDAIPVSLPSLARAPRASGDPLIEIVRDALAASGLCEMVSLAFLSPADLDRLDLDAKDPRRKTVALQNPLGETQSSMRTTLLPALLRAASLNHQRGSERVRMFEVGRVFYSRSGEMPKEPRHVAAIITGPRDSWLGEGPPVEFCDLTGILEELAERLGLEIEMSPHAIRPFHPGESAQIRIDGKVVGYGGQVDPRIREQWNIGQPCFLFELCLEEVPRPAVVQVHELARFPAIVRDLSIFVPETLTWAELRKTVRECAVPHLEAVSLIDEYRPKQGRRGWLVRFRYRAPDRTLTDDEINRDHENVAVQAVLSHFAVERR